MAGHSRPGWARASSDWADEWPAHVAGSMKKVGHDSAGHDRSGKPNQDRPNQRTLQARPPPEEEHPPKITDPVRCPSRASPSHTKEDTFGAVNGQRAIEATGAPTMIYDESWCACCTLPHQHRTVGRTQDDRTEDRTQHRGPHRRPRTAPSTALEGEGACAPWSWSQRFVTSNNVSCNL